MNIIFAKKLYRFREATLKCVSIVVCLLALFSLAVVGCAQNQNAVVGTWTGSDVAGHPIVLELLGSGQASLSIDTTILGGTSNTVFKERKVGLIYRVDELKTPATIDLIMTEDGVVHKNSLMKGIYRLINNDQMELRIRTGDGPRYKAFDSTDKENTIMLNKRE